MKKQRKKVSRREAEFTAEYIAQIRRSLDGATQDNHFYADLITACDVIERFRATEKETEK